jgi:predicted PurR-regulated permease PerM
MPLTLRSGRSGAGADAGLAGFATRLLLIGLSLAFALALWRLRDAVMVAFGSIVLAVGFRGLADALSRRTGLPAGLALAAVVAGCLGLLALSFEVFGAAMSAQFGELSRKLPESISNLVARLHQTPIGEEVVRQAREAARSAAAGPGPRVVGRLIGAAAQAATYALVMIAGGVFLAIDPARYRAGFLRLAPPSQREHASDVLAALALALRRWLVARVVVMAAVGVLSSLGLWALGIDAPFALGLTGAILTFIPTVGSVMAALPGMLIGFLQDPIKAVAVALVFWAVHFIEGTFITPYVQDEAVDIPPVISIFSTVVFGVLLGPAGVLLTGPITVVAMVLVERLYVEDVLGERAAAPQAARPFWRRQPARRGVGAPTRKS